MRCTKCGYENTHGMKFCGECASTLTKTYCPNCGFENPPQFKFCGECATPLLDKTTPSKSTHIQREPHHQEGGDAKVIPILSERNATEAERRQLTAMFCDLVGSTSLSEQLDPEDLRDVVRTYQEACAEVIDKHEGYIGQYLGDGLLVYFGYPLAHEDDAQRAVRAGLEIVGALHELSLHNTQLRQPVQVRIGIHTGPVVVGEIGRGEKREQLALGDTLNIASRLQNSAEPNTVVISSATYRLTEGFFECRDLGLHTLKGVSTPVRMYRILGESAVRSRFEFAVSKGLTPLVGRKQEVGLLLERWEQAKEGRGQIILLNGEAGIGKSRLVQVMKEHVSGESYASIESRCSPYYQNSALYPVIDLLHRLLQFRREDPPEEKLDKLESGLEQYGLSLKETMPLFGPLLSLPLPENYPPLTLTPQKQKQKTLEALAAWLLTEAARKPIIRIFEDVQWADPSTLEYLSLLIENVQAAPVYMIITFRPDFKSPWTMKSHISNVTLNRLTRRNVKAMIKKLTHGKSLPEEIVKQIVAKTDGIPLFVEELTKMVLESGLMEEQSDTFVLAKPLPVLDIPATLQDSLMSRIDRLGEVKELIQLSSTLGKEFPYELVKAAALMDDNTLQKGLNRIIESELIFQRGFPPDSTYFFKHALIRDAAYNSLLKSKRQKYHGMIAEILETRFQNIAETQPEVIAYHLTQTGSREKAVGYWKKAGQKAIERSAHVEAAEHLKRGLELLSELPDNVDRTHLELELLIALAGTLRVTKGFASSEVEKIYSRAYELSQKVGDKPEIFAVLRGLCGYYIARAESQRALRVADQCLRLADMTRDSALGIQAHYLLGATNFCRGEISLAKEHAGKGAMLYDPEKHGSHTLLYGQDPGVACLFWDAWALWFLGYPDQARERSHEALRIAKKLSHSYSLAIAYVLIAFINHYRREGHKAKEHAEASIAILKEHGYEFFIEMGTILVGWALVKHGQGEVGMLKIEHGLNAWRETGAELFRPYWLALLAEAYWKVGNTEKAISMTAEALETSKNNSELYYEAELYRLKGEFFLTRSPDNQTEAESSFRRAIDISVHQSAKSLELRATTSLSRLLKSTGRKDEAQRMLAEIFGWFTEGFDTGDLVEAKALLEELRV